MAADLSREVGDAAQAVPHHAARATLPGSGRRRFGRPMIVLAVAAGLLLLVGLPLLWMLRGAPSPESTPLDSLVTSTLWKSGAAGDEPLSGGGSVRPGDRLYIFLSNQVPVHLYVIDQDASGEAYVLFPLEQAQWSNPIPPGAGRRIPGETSFTYDSWEVTSAHGNESVIVVASLEPLAGLERALGRIGGASPGEVTRSLDPNQPQGGAAAAPDAAALAAEIASLRHAPAAGRNFIIRETTVANPR